MEVILKNLTAAEYVDPAIRDAVASTFRGELQNETECTGCKNKTRRQESFNELELGVRKDLNESLDDLLKEEILTLSEQYFCSVCDSKNDAIRRTKLLKLPPVLNLQLMRFVFDRYGHLLFDDIIYLLHTEYRLINIRRGRRVSNNAT